MKEISQFTRNWNIPNKNGTITIAHNDGVLNHVVTVVREEGVLKCSFIDNQDVATETAINAIFNELNIEPTSVHFCSGKEINKSFLSILHNK